MAPAQPGWYEDPDDAAFWRHWDGSSWGERKAIKPSSDGIAPPWMPNDKTTTTVAAQEKKRWRFGKIAAVALVVMLVIGSLLPDPEPSPSSASSSSTPARVSPSPSPSPSPAPGSSLTMGQQNAVRKANDYLRVMPFSKSGLVTQLEFEGYSRADATTAVNSITVDWNEQAAKKAQSYLSVMAFSKSGLITQLEFDGFTRAQAEYGVAKAGY